MVVGATMLVCLHVASYFINGTYLPLPEITIKFLCIYRENKSILSIMFSTPYIYYYWLFWLYFDILTQTRALCDLLKFTNLKIFLNFILKCELFVFFRLQLGRRCYHAGLFTCCRRNLCLRFVAFYFGQVKYYLY